VPDAQQAFAEALRASGSQAVVDETAIVLSEEQRIRQKLALLLEVSKALTRAPDVVSLLEKIAEIVFQILDVDRFSILLLDEERGSDTQHRPGPRRREPRAHVPLSIARTAIEEKVAILSDNAPEDVRFTGQSIVHQQVRSAVCAPLIGTESRVTGVLYVDSLTSAHRFTEDDLDFVVAFSGIVAVAIENSRFAERIRHETLVRSNFERFFSPAMAARIAQSPDASELGGERRRVAVLFGDIRNFTPLSATMEPGSRPRCCSRSSSPRWSSACSDTAARSTSSSAMRSWPSGARHHGAGRRRPRARRRRRHDAVARAVEHRWREQGRPAASGGHRSQLRRRRSPATSGRTARLEFTVIGDTVNTANRLVRVGRGWRDPDHAGASGCVDAAARRSSSARRCRCAARPSRSSSIARSPDAMTQAPAGYYAIHSRRRDVVALGRCADAVRRASVIGRCTRTRHAPGATRAPGRGRAYAVPLPDGETRVVVRHSRHGGLLAPVTGDRFFRQPVRRTSSNTRCGSPHRRSHTRGDRVRHVSRGRPVRRSDVATREVDRGRT
jgi:class 3 adenylate cyclase